MSCTIQRADREIEGRRSKTSRNGGSWWAGSRENTEQKKIREVIKYLVWWKGFTAEQNI